MEKTNELLSFKINKPKKIEFYKNKFNKYMNEQIIIKIKKQKLNPLINFN